MSTRRATAQQGRTLLLDIGGVLTVDPWETLLLDPDHGIAARLGIPHAAARATARMLWRKYVVLSEAAEEDYWSELSTAWGVRIPARLVRVTEARLLTPAPGAKDALLDAQHSGTRVGVISDNTAFWYAKQRALLGLRRIIDPSLEFVSCYRGVSKSHTPGLFELAVEYLDPQSTVVLDDRRRNVERARRVGFHAVQVGRDARSLTDIVSRFRVGPAAVTA